MSAPELSLNDKFQVDSEEAIDYISLLQELVNIMDANPALAEKWDDYAEKFNHLADVMELHGIEVKLLRDVVNSAVELRQMFEDVALKNSGCGYAIC